jgi:hypothetical protein
VLHSFLPNLKFDWRRRYRFLLRFLCNLTGGSLVLLAVYTSLTRADNHPTQDFWTCASHVAIFQDIFDRGEGWCQAIGKVEGRMPYEVGLGWVASRLDSTPSRVLRTAEIINILFLSAGLVVFGRRWTSKSTPWGLLIVVPLLFWGRGFYQTTEYHLALLPLVGHYHTTFSVALALFSLALLADCCRRDFPRRDWRVHSRLVGAAFLGGGVALCHSITSFFFLIPMSVVTILFQCNSRSQRRYGMLFFPAMMLVVLLWPWRGIAISPLMSYLQSERKGEVVVSPSAGMTAAPEMLEKSARTGGFLERFWNREVTFNPSQYKVHLTVSEVFLRAPALKLGWLYLVFLIFLRPRKRVTWAIVSATGFLLAGWAFSGYLLKFTQGGRFLYYLGFLLQLTTIRSLWDSTAAPRWKWVLSFPLLFCLYLPMRDCLAGFQENFHSSKTLIRLPGEELAEIRGRVGDDKVLGDLETINYLTAFGIKPVWSERQYGVLVPAQAPSALQNWWACPLDGKSLAQAVRESGSGWFLFDKVGIHDLKQVHAATRPFFQTLYSRSPALEAVYESDVYILYRIHNLEETSDTGNRAFLQAIEEAPDLFQWGALHTLYEKCVEKDPAVLTALEKQEETLLQHASIRGELMEGVEVVGFKWVLTQAQTDDRMAEYRGTWLFRVTRKPVFDKTGVLNVALFGKTEPEYRDVLLKQGFKKPEFGFTLTNLPYPDWREGGYYQATRLFSVPAVPYRLETCLGFDSGSGSKQLGKRIDLGQRFSHGD